MKRAKTATECAAHGKYCHPEYRMWDVLGGFQSKTACEACSHVYKNKSPFRAGVWGSAKASPLYWKERKYDKVNVWEQNAFEEDKFHEWINGAVSKMYAMVEATRMMCLMNPFKETILTVAEKCTGSGGGGTQATQVAYDVAKT